MSFTPEQVQAESDAWVWVPEVARDLHTEEFWLIAYPEHFAEPTTVVHLRSERDPDALIDDVLAAAADLGRGRVAFFGVSALTRPPTLEARLAERGELFETFDVLALDLDDPEAPLDVPTDVECRQVLDLATLVDLERIGTTVFGGTQRSEDEIARSLEEVREAVDDPRWVAYRDGLPLGTAGMAFAGDVARLWGGAVVGEARHTGVYRALLDQRLRLARQRGCRMALVKGRVETSGPVLRRVGFQAYGQERAYRVEPD